MDGLKPFDLTYADFELLHNFSTSTCYAVADSPESVIFWQTTLPKMGFSYPFVLHLMLAVSALHLAHSQPERRESYMAQGEHHYGIALRSVIVLLPSMDAVNCEAMYMSAVLICLYKLGRGPQPGEYLAFSDQGDAEWMKLLQGVRAIIQSMTHVLSSGILAPIVKAGTQKQKPPAERKIPPNYRENIEKLRRFIAEARAGDPNAQAYIEALDCLSQSFTGFYEGTDGTRESDYSNIIFAWLYRVSGEFSLRLQQKQPVVLVILAYFTILLKELDCIWYMSGWVPNITTGIHLSLPEDYRIWLQWPMEHIRRNSG